MPLRPAGFCLVHGEVGTLQDLVDALFAAVEDDDADACRSEMPQFAEHELLAEFRQDTVARGDGAQRGVGGIRSAVLEHDHEFVAADARYQIPRLDAALEPGRDLRQELVAHIVALRVVQRLEIVQVDEEQRAVVAMPFASLRHLRHAVEEHAPVRQPVSVSK